MENYKEIFIKKIIKEERVKKVKEINEAIRNLEHREKYSKNPMEKRQLRSQIGGLQRELKLYE